jgi:hypothetical protein
MDANGHEYMKEISPQSRLRPISLLQSPDYVGQGSRGNGAVLLREGGNSLRARRASEVNSILIRVNSRAFAVALLSASICVHLRLVFLFLEV